jgi:hypothetical protein
MRTRLGSILLRSWRVLRRDGLSLIGLNIIWLLASAPGWIVVAYGAAGRLLPLVVIGLIFLLPWPLATFGLFDSVLKLVLGQPAGVGNFARCGLARWRTGLVWGGINIFVLAVLLSNARFYLSPGSPMAGTATGAAISSFFLSATAAWLIWQTLALPILAEEPSLGLWHAHRRAASVMASQPLDVFIVIVLILALAAASVVIVPLGLLFGASLVSVLATETVAVAQGRPDPDAPMESGEG